MKTESSDPIADADALFALAVEQAKRAIAAARNEPSLALAASEAKCETLEAKIQTLDDSMARQKEDLESARELAQLLNVRLTDQGREIREFNESLDAARTVIAQRNTELAGRDATIAGLQADLADLRSSTAAAQAALAKDRDGLAFSRVELARERAAFAKEQETARLERASLEDSRTGLVAERRAFVEKLKRQIKKQECSIEALVPSNTTVPGPASKAPLPQQVFKPAVPDALNIPLPAQQALDPAPSAWRETSEQTSHTLSCLSRVKGRRRDTPPDSDSEDGGFTYTDEERLFPSKLMKSTGLIESSREAYDPARKKRKVNHTFFGKRPTPQLRRPPARRIVPAPRSTPRA